MDDAEAVSRALRGDRSGAEALLERYQMDVYNSALRLLHNPADAEDAAQDVFLRAFGRLGQYRLGEPFGAWLAGITRHRCIDLIRARPRALPQEPEPTQDVEQEAIAHLEADEIRAALGRLPDRERALLVLRYWEDLSVARIAEVLEMTEGAAKVALLRARRAMAAAMTRQGSQA